MPWYVYSLLFSLFFAVIPLKKRGIVECEENVMFWSSGFVFILLMFLLPLIEFPNNRMFYIIGIVSGVSGVLGGLMQINLSKHNSGRVMPMQMIVQIFACFAFYSFLNPSYYSELISRPFGSIFVVICIVLLLVLSFFLRKSDISLKGVLTVLPVSLLFAFIVAYYKIMVNEMPTGVGNIILVYVMAHFFTIFMFFLIKNLFGHEGFIRINEKLLSDSIIIALLFLFGYYFLFMAVYYSVNPALVLVFNLLVPVWIKIYSVITNRKDDVRIDLALFILLITGIMVIAS